MSDGGGREGRCGIRAGVRGAGWGVRCRPGHGEPSAQPSLSRRGWAEVWETGLGLGAGASRPTAGQSACLGPAAVPRLALSTRECASGVGSAIAPDSLQCIETACVRSALPRRVLVSGGIMASLGWYHLFLDVPVST